VPSVRTISGIGLLGAFAAAIPFVAAAEAAAEGFSIAEPPGTEPVPARDTRPAAAELETSVSTIRADPEAGDVRTPGLWPSARADPAPPRENNEIGSRATSAAGEGKGDVPGPWKVRTGRSAARSAVTRGAAGMFSGLGDGPVREPAGPAGSEPPG